MKILSGLLMGVIISSCASHNSSDVKTLNGRLKIEPGGVYLLRGKEVYTRLAGLFEISNKDLSPKWIDEEFSREPGLKRIIFGDAGKSFVISYASERNRDILNINDALDIFNRPRTFFSYNLPNEIRNASAVSSLREQIRRSALSPKSRVCICTQTRTLQGVDIVSPRAYKGPPIPKSVLSSATFAELGVSADIMQPPYNFVIVDTFILGDAY